MFVCVYTYFMLLFQGWSHMPQGHVQAIKHEQHIQTCLEKKIFVCQEAKISSPKNQDQIKKLNPYRCTSLDKS